MSTTIVSGNGIGTTAEYIGPFRDGNGNLYTFMNSVNKMYKSSTDGASWAAVDTAGEPTTFVNSAHVWQEGTALHIVTKQSSTNTLYHRFNTSDAGANPDEWVEIETTVNTPAQTVSGNPPTGIVVRSSGDRVVICPDAERVHGTDYIRPIAVEYVSSWGSAIALGGTGTQFNWHPAAIALGEAGKVHFVVRDGQQSDWMHTSLADGSSTPSANEDIEANAGSNDGMSTTRGIYNDEAGVESIKFLGTRSTDLELNIYEIRDDGTPEALEAVTSGEDPNVRAILINATDHPTSARLIVVYADSATDDFWMRQDTGSGWGSATEILDGVAHSASTTMCGNAYFNSSGDYVIGWVWYDGSNTVFDEYVLVATAAGTSLVIPRRVDRMINLRR